jgi:predicted transcriptional regulator
MSSQRRAATIGDQELALLQFVGQQGRATVAQAVEGFGAPRGLARSTVLTMMERLRRKGYLTRRPIDGVYHYVPRTLPAAAVRQAVEGFVARTLGGSVAPFVSYLAEQEQLSDAEIAELEALLKRVQTGRTKKN